MFKKIFTSIAILLSTFPYALAQDTSGSLSYYIGGSYNFSETDVDAGGFNTFGGFSAFDCGSFTFGGITCSDSEDIDGWSVFLGVDQLTSISENASLRAEIEYASYGDANYVSGSFPGTFPPGFFYSTSVMDLEVGFVNAYLDLHVPDSPLTVFLGGGLGVARSEISTNDTVVSGSVSDTNFAYNFGAGVRFEIAPNVELFGNARFVNFGETAIPLIGGIAGEYTLAQTAKEVRIGVIVKLGHKP